jgi:hypothetical protein
MADDEDPPQTAYEAQDVLGTMLSNNQDQHTYVGNSDRTRLHDHEQQSRHPANSTATAYDMRSRFAISTMFSPLL